MTSAKKNISHEPRRPVDWAAFKDEIRRAYPIEDALRRLTNVKLTKRAGTPKLGGCCPFHKDTSPSFEVNAEKGLYQCYSFGCGVRGDIFSLYRDMRGLDFKGAAIAAADDCGVPVPEEIRNGKARLGAAAAPRRLAPVSDLDGVPADLKPNDMLPVPSHFRRPKVGEPFALWHQGGDDKRPALLTYRPPMVHRYIDVDSTPLLAVLRVHLSNGKKTFIPARVGRLPDDAPARARDANGMGWLLKGATGGHARPIYNIHRTRAWLSVNPVRLLIVEGEKTCDAAVRLLADTPEGRETLIVTTMGGGAATLFADWSGFARKLKESGRPLPQVLVWPDADRPKERRDGTLVDCQELFARQVLTGLAQGLQDAGLDLDGFHASRIIPPAGVEHGWDLADAESEGWTATNVIDHLNTQTVPVPMSKLSVSPRDIPAVAEPAAGEAAALAPFDQDPGLAEFDAAFSELGDALEAAQPEEPEILNFEADLSGPADAGEAFAPRREVMAEAPVIDMDDDFTGPGANAGGGDIDGIDGIDGIDDDVIARIENNPHFRCLGHVGDVSYFLSLDRGCIFDLSPSNMRDTQFLHLAPLPWWQRIWPKRNQRQEIVGVDWLQVQNALITGTNKVGVWDPNRESGKGARLDRGRIVFNAGQSLYVEGEGSMPVNGFRGEKTYTASSACRMPDIDNPFPAESAEVLKLLEIIRTLDWRPETRGLSILSLFGWITLAPLCGILKWRPHLWIDGPAGSGKSWIIDKVIAPALGDYKILAKSNSTESGLRNLLAGKALPLVLDEAEGENARDKSRMDDILKLARHSASDDQSVVAQGVMGGGGNRTHAIASMFLLSSITSQISAVADQSRFARAHLGRGQGLDKFMSAIEEPASELLTPEFADRLIGRMITRASDYTKIHARMTRALTELGMERRFVDVYGSLATGAWMALCDGVPVDSLEARFFIGDRMEALAELKSRSAEIVEDKDHVRLFQTIMAHEVRVDGQNGGPKSARLGTLLRIAVGARSADGFEEDTMISSADANKVLLDMGMRAGKPHPDKENEIAVLEAGDAPVFMLIHKNAAPMIQVLKDTPYSRNFGDVMKQADGVKNAGAVRFGGLGVSRCIAVPLEQFWIKDGE